LWKKVNRFKAARLFSMKMVTILEKPIPDKIKQIPSSLFFMKNQINFPVYLLAPLSSYPVCFELGLVSVKQRQEMWSILFSVMKH
jgi:hypothetical protein